MVLSVLKFTLNCCEELSFPDLKRSLLVFKDLKMGNPESILRKHRLHMQQKIFTLAFFLFFCSLSHAQLINDECFGAIRFDEVQNFCSEIAEFSNNGATQSTQTDPNCFPPTFYGDVWFVFTAIATDASIAIKGLENVKPGGTIRTPQFALYSGDCNGLVEVQCTAPLGVATTAQSFSGNLVIGQDYYIRVAASNQRVGTFQICVNNFNAIPDLSSDCGSGLVLCDKSPFTVPSILTSGNVSNELEGIFCQDNRPVTEDQSTWFKWVCEDPGTLSFDIIPIDPDDDIDFVVFELPNGLNDCAEKEPLRIMLSGMNQNDPAGLTWAQCIGNTGLRANDPDERENCGCDPDDNNYARPIDMIAGRAYAIVILNFTSSGNGFTIEFGGTGTIRGPRVDLATNLINLGLSAACIGQEIEITDASFFEGGITDWSWNFGPNADLEPQTTQGPHLVSFDRPGAQSVLLSVTSVDGCIVSEVVEVDVVCCDDHFDVDGQIVDASCPDASDGAIDLSASSDYGITTIEWDVGSNQEDIDNLRRGSYEVTIADSATCVAIRSFTVSSPDSFRVETLIDMPTCDGGQDGAIDLNVNGAVAPYEYIWAGRPSSSEDTIQRLPVGDYAVTIRDANNCTTEETIEVRELSLELDPSVTSTIDPSCTDFMDGSISISVSNGLAPFEFDWNGDQVFQGTSSLSNLLEGSYSVQIRDANRCLGDFSFEIQDPEPIEVFFDIDPVSCFGEQDATLTAIGRGGNAPYQYQWNTGSQNSTLNQVGAGDYALTLSDGNNCRLDTILALDQPDTIFFSNILVEDVLCFGEATGRISILGGGGTPPFDFRISGADFIPDNNFLNLPAGNYQIELRDAEGCSINTIASITEPPQLSVDAGENRIIQLGSQTVLEATPSAFPVSFFWTPMDDLTCEDCQSPLALPFFTTTYSVLVTDPDGCTAADQVTITVAKPRKVYKPTAFSPNNDGNNDFFTLYADESATLIRKLKIFDRWGNLLFEGTDLPPGEEALGWDGTFKGERMMSGVYVYFAEVVFLDGISVIEKGDITLAR